MATINNFSLTTKNVQTAVSLYLKLPISPKKLSSRFYYHPLGWTKLPVSHQKPFFGYSKSHVIWLILANLVDLANFITSDRNKTHPLTHYRHVTSKGSTMRTKLRFNIFTIFYYYVLKLTSCFSIKLRAHR